ncbi:MAG: hypothetical protein M0R17_00960 [Candidatus Omnitrophica bacterium]|jgi:hypothetical protein|nr:hypothetical protein [Candidatus Omnitrophota bacterium]
MKKILAFAVLILCLNTLLGCAGAYGDYYHTINIAQIKNKNKMPNTIVVENTPYIDYDTLEKYNLRLLGYSAFIGYYNSNTTSIGCATEQGSEVDADLVIVTTPELINSTTRLVPIDHEATVNTNSNTTYNGTIYGNNSSIGYSGNAYSNSRSTIQYTTDEYRTFNTYKFHAIYLERK